MPGAGLPSGSASAPANMVANDTDNTLADGVDFELGSSSGTKFGTATTQKLAFFNSTPRAQGIAISSPAGGATQDAESRAAINSLINLLKASGGFGLIA